jgi:hypothetical protein
MVVLDGRFWPGATEIRWSGLRNQTVQFCGCRELVPASVLVFVFVPGTSFCSAVTSFGFLSMSDFAWPLVEVSLRILVCPWLPLTNQ